MIECGLIGVGAIGEDSGGIKVQYYLCILYIIDWVLGKGS